MSVKRMNISRRTQFGAQKEMGLKALRSGTVLELHAVGAAVPRAINLALQLRSELNNCCDLDTNTSTVNFVDDIEPTTDDGDFKTQIRHNSAIHIRITGLAVMKL